MKRTKFLKRLVYSSGCLLMLLLAACRSGETPVVVDAQSTTDRATNWTAEMQYPVFSSANERVNRSLTRLNREISAYLAAQQEAMKEDADALFTDFTDQQRPAWNYELVVNNRVYRADDHYVSLQLELYRYMGGAHGTTDFVALNYDVASEELLSANDILDLRQSSKINQLLQANFGNPEQCFDTDPTMELVSAVCFSPDTVYFTFGHYALGAYACGPAEILVPQEELGEAFLPQIGSPLN
ncbi:DUF4163 domain-containing protein [Mangrovibacterium marinum]|uniref:Uncharacterized protein DUF4163 n=1 Tax=Mangrovibacterium marinum TaxID=1639118 RepID=A0A2T5C3U2_9BACT|nr:DUF4163 domain-containing protein [Mangrovibacterium marinum]PTN09399.1 uncharacterized protein DUF4163 [Mangrovibacterium marinum]